jgi:hypothetical protein
MRSVITNHLANISNSPIVQQVAPPRAEPKDLIRGQASADCAGRRHGPAPEWSALVLSPVLPLRALPLLPLIYVKGYGDVDAQGGGQLASAAVTVAGQSLASSGGCT